jgi:hypothetical protein
MNADSTAGGSGIVAYLESFSSWIGAWNTTKGLIQRVIDLKD